MSLDIEIKKALFAPANEGEETAEIYRREARVIYQDDKEGAASLLIDAAYANDRDDNPPEVIVRDLKLAVALCPNTNWVYAAAHRLLLKLGYWRDVLELLEKELALSSSPDEGIAICLAQADIYWIMGENPIAAMMCTQKALQFDATNVGALYEGLWIGDVTAQESFAQSMAKILGAPPERAVLYALAGSIRSARKDDAGALECYTQAAQTDRSNPYVLLKYAILCERFGKLTDAAQAYAQIAQIVQDPELSGELYRRAGVIQEYCGSPERSGYYLGEAQKRIDNKYNVIWLACAANRRTGNAQRVIELERQLIEIAPDDETRASHWLSIADIAFDQLGALDRAIEALEAASRLGASAIADPRLAAIYEAKEDWENHAEVIHRMAQTASWDAPCLTWLLGDAYARSGHSDEAIECYTAIKNTLGKLPLELAYHTSQNYETHARMLENWIKTTSDPGTQDALLSQIVTILYERLHAPEIAVQYLRELKPSRVSSDILWKRLHLAYELRHYPDVVACLVQFAKETTDKDESLMWMMEAARIEDREIHNLEDTVELLKTVHEKEASYVPAIVMLHAIGLREKRYDLIMLANTWRDTFQLSTAKRAESARENAWASLKMGDLQGASAWFEKARKLEPLPPYYLRLYIDLLKSTSRWTDTVQIISETLTQSQTRSTANLEDLNTDENDVIDEDEDLDEPNVFSVEQGALREMMYDIQTFCLNHPTGLSYARQLTYEKQPTFSSAFNYLFEKIAVDPVENLRAVIGDIRARVSTLTPEVKALLDWAESEIIRSQCPNGADPKTAGSILILLKRSLDERYGSCLRLDVLRTIREIPRENVTEWLEQYAELTPDNWMRMALSLEAAERAVWIENDTDTARRVLSQSLVRADSDRRTLWMLELFSAITEDWKALGYFREKLAQIEIVPQAKLQTLKTALAPYVDDNLTDHAVRVAQECLKLNGHDLPSLVTLAHIAEDSGDTLSLASIADRLSESSAFSDNRTEYGLWAAQLWSKSLNKPEQALASLGRLLSLEPTCLPAITMSEPLHEQLGRFEQLGRIYSRAISLLPEGHDQIELLRKQANLLSAQLNDAPAACLSFSKITKQSPDDIDALSSLSELLIQQERWNEAVEVIEKLAQVVDTPEQRRENNLHLAEILVHQIDQPERAKRILRKHLGEFEHDMVALQLLYDIACTERDWNYAKTILDEICQAEGTIEARHARMAFTRIAREAGWSHDIRTLYERQAIAAVLGHRDDFDALVEDYKSHNELPRLIEVAKRELSQQGNPEQISLYRGCIAALLVENKQHREALAFLSEVIHDTQNTDWAYLARAQALTSAGQLDSAVGEFRRTLTRNIRLEDAYAPFVEVLKQTGDGITYAGVTAVRDLHRGKKQPKAWERCIKGTPRGFFDVEHMALARNLVDAQRYLRTMTPYAFELFSNNMQLKPLDSTHWAYGRCHRLFGQNLEIKQLYSARGLKKELCKVRMQLEPALIFDETILDENSPIPFDFWAAYAMHQAVTGGCIIDALNDTSVEALFMALVQAKPDLDLAQTMKKNLFKLLPRPERKLFKDGVPFLAPNWSDFRRALQTRAACVAAVISACPAYALYAHPHDEALEVFLISEGFVRFVRTYWTSGIGMAV